MIFANRFILPIYQVNQAEILPRQIKLLQGGVTGCSRFM
jgi:hypothetical protein